MASVEFEHIYKRFGDVEIVHDINLKIEDKEFLVLVGPSGCGKSTCLQMIAGLEQSTSGAIKIGDDEVTSLEPRERDIAMVFQNYALYPHMNVYDNMAFGLRLRGAPEPEIDKKVHEAAEILGLENLLQRKPKELSGGQRQRVALGRAIVRDPKVFLMDEPLSNLDAKLRVQMRAEIARLHQRMQTTFIYVTHDQTEAMTMGDRIAVLNSGKIQQIGRPGDLYDRPANKFVAGFIGSPSMNFFEDVAVEQKEGIWLRLGDGQRLRAPQALAARLEPYIGKTITLGIRPEHVLDRQLLNGNMPLEAAAQTVRVTADVVEHLGNELMVYGMLAGVQLAARQDGRSRVRRGDEVTFVLDLEHAHIFDPETEVCLTSLPPDAGKEAVEAVAVTRAEPTVSLEQKAAERARLQKRNRRIRWAAFAAAFAVIVLILAIIPTPPPEAPPAALADPTKGDTIDNIQCQADVQTGYQAQAHLGILLNIQPDGTGDQKIIPDNVGRQAKGCTYWLSTSATNGVIQINAPKQQDFTLQQFFDIWGQQLSKDTVADCTPLVGSVVVYTYDPTQAHANDQNDPNHGWKQVDVTQIQKIVLINHLDIDILCGVGLGTQTVLPDYYFKQG
ncbi:MAG TPA: sn-glycerol-3-phosphate ABC transporter ATP-binding protein UgpC [Ktedonobacterales bacterium]|jgi:multiple sugar transport system ATP-binding protein